MEFIMNYIAVFTLLLLSTISNADLKPLGLGDLDAFVSKIPDLETQSIQHSYNVQANFSIGSTEVDYKTCSRHSKRKANTFYGCWLNQSQEFLNKLSFILSKKAIKRLNTTVTFKLSNSGSPVNIKIKGFNHDLTKSQLTNILKEMEFASSNLSADQYVTINIQSIRT